MKPSITICFATMTGNAETLARRAEACAHALGWLPQLCNLSELSPADLTRETRALFIVSTWGDGEPPTDADAFFRDLNQASAAPLPHLRYAVLGLGDRDYADFNACARQLDERLAALGAQRLHPRVEADLDFDDTYAEWEARIFPLLAADLAARPALVA
jgi:flavodoxin I